MNKNIIKKVNKAILDYCALCLKYAFPSGKWELAIPRVYVFIGIFIGIFICLIIATFIAEDIKISKAIDVFAMPIIVSISLVVAILSFNQHEEINKKHMEQKNMRNAFVIIYKHIKDIKNYTRQLDSLVLQHKIIKDTDMEVLSFTDRLLKKESITEEEIHEWICVKKIKDKQCKMKPEGADMINLILSIINTYEVMSSGIQNGILDRDVSLGLMKENIINNFEKYKIYIYHRRAEHDNKELAVIWEKLYKEIK